MFGFLRIFRRNDEPPQEHDTAADRATFDGLPPTFYTERRDFVPSATRKIRVEGAVDVMVRRYQGQSVPPGIVVAAERKEDLSKVRTYFEDNGGTLVIGVRASATGTSINSGNVHIHARGKITINGQTVSGFSTGRLAVGVEVVGLQEVAIEGSGNVTVEDVLERRFHAEVRGSGDITVSGTVVDLRACVRGSGDIDARNLQAQCAFLQVDGSGDIDAKVLEDVDAYVRGSGDISVLGQPKRRNENVSGSGKVKFFKFS